MALLLLLSISFVFTLRALLGWRTGILLMIVLAAIQDPLRKLVPGTPGWLVLLSAPVFLAAIFASTIRTRNWWAEFRFCYPSIASSLRLLVFLSLPAAFLSATYGAGSWMLTIFGAFSYSVIFFAIIAIPALMVMLSVTLRPRVNRAVNLVVASLYIPICVFNAAGATSDWAFYYVVTIGVEVLILAFILRTAWTWPRRSTVTAVA